MSAGLTAEDVRRIVREENLRLLRVMVEVNSVPGGERIARTALSVPVEVARAVQPAGGTLDRVILDYREGR